jgi:choline kinase
MQAVILAAGLGSRLRPLTSEIPKAMVEYKNVQIIVYQINALISVGVKEIIIVLGYKGSILKDFLISEFNESLFSFVINEEYEKTNSAFSFSFAQPLVKSDPYIHINCDILFSKNLLKSMISSSFENCICVREDIQLTESMEKVQINGSSRIRKMSLEANKYSNFKAYGLAKVSKKALNLNLELFNNTSEEITRKENYYGLIRNNLDNIEYNIIKSDEYNLAEINTVDDLERCQFNSD